MKTRQFFARVLFFVGLIIFMGLAGKLSLQSSTENMPLTTLPLSKDGIEIPGATIIYYDIRGNTAEELNRQMDQLGPKDDNGKTGHGSTHWHIAVNVPGTVDGCDMSQISTLLEIEVLLPHWVNQDNADPILIEKWERFILTLVKHEQGHVEIALEYYPKVKETTQHATCDTVNAIAETIFAQIRDANLRYDEATQYGVTQDSALR